VLGDRHNPYAFLGCVSYPLGLLQDPKSSATASLAVARVLRGFPELAGFGPLGTCFDALESQSATTMDGRHIIPVTGANQDDPVVVVEVRQNGSHPLDVRLVGCEGENPYVATSKIGSISASFPFLTRLSSQTA
jgi:hypothetical protein